jgi:hypothetical protein
MTVCQTDGQTGHSAVEHFDEQFSKRERTFLFQCSTPSQRCVNGLQTTVSQVSPGGLFIVFDGVCIFLHNANHCLNALLSRAIDV